MDKIYSDQELLQHIVELSDELGRVRGIIRDALSLYLGYEIISGYITGQFAMTNIAIAVMVSFALAIWFILERIGVLPKM